MTLISIITVNYNNIGGLQRTWRSLRSQGTTEFEWVVVDGGSCDGSVAFMESVREASWPFRFAFITEEDKGIYDAMNKGVALSTGDFALFLNSGDTLYECETLSKLNSVVDESRRVNEGLPPVLYGDYVRVMPGGRELYSRAKEPRYIKRGMPTSHQAILYPMCFLKENPYDLKYRISSDYYITCKAYSLAFPLKKVDMIISKFRTGGTASQNSRLVIKDMALIQREVLKMPSWQVWLHAARRYINILAVRMLHQQRFGSSLLLKMINAHARR